MSENTFFDFGTESKSENLQSKNEDKQYFDDEDLKPVKGLEALDNVSIDIPKLMATSKNQSDQEEAPVSKHQKDVLSEMIADDVQEQQEIQKLMSNRRALSDKLQNDPEFDKRYKKAELEYFDKVNGKKSNPDMSVPNDEMYKQAQALVERIHNKTGQRPEHDTLQDESDPHGLSRFGEVLQNVPEDPDVDLDDKQRKPTEKGQPVIIIKKVKALNLNIYFNK